MVKKPKKRLKKVPLSKNILILVFSVLVCVVIILGWLYFRETYPATANKKSVYENRQTIVVNNVKASNGLVNTLMNEKSGCIEQSGQKNVVYIIREVEDYAFVQYGCDLNAHAYYRKDGNKWVGLNPTNKFYLGIPFCRALKEDKIPRKVQATCWDGSVGKKGKSPALAVNPVK